ncbi:uncharacterized protein TNCV_546381 [Trichonephila clavipes]|nr:uncharacterized protein TNCV_546381 [Trichonephila clavipes]
MRMTIHHRTWGRKLLLGSENRVRNYFHTTYPGRFIGCGGPVAWTPRSSNLNLLKFFFFSHQKSLAYQTPMAAVDDPTTRIIVASADNADTPDCFESVL